MKLDFGETVREVLGMSSSIIADTEVPGWSSKNELGLLGSLASRVPEGGVIVELGSFAGRTASIMAKNAPHAKVYCVDPWGYFDIRMVPEYSLSYMSGDLSRFRPGELYEIFLKNVEDCPNIVPMRGLSTEVPWNDMPPVDLIFIDADHDTEPLYADITIWWPRMHPNGIVVGHDWQMRTVKDGVIKFLEYINERQEYPQVLNFPTVSIWGLLKGARHAQSWGIDFSGVYPYTDDNWHQKRDLEEIRALVTKAVEGVPFLKGSE